MKKIIITIFITLIFLYPPQIYASSGGWGTSNITGTMIGESLNKLLQTIIDAAASAAKMAAISQATSTINSLLYSANQPRNIGNYVTFLAEIPYQEANTYAENFLTEAMRGASSSDFTGSGGSDLSENVESAGQFTLTALADTSIPTIDFQDECTGEDYFSEGNFKCFTKITSNPLNMPIGMAVATEDAFVRSYLQKKEMQEANAAYSGVISSMDDDGNIKLPSAMVLEIQNQQIKLPLAALAAGDTDVYASFIKSFAATLSTKIVTECVHQASQSVGL
jgi:hypothetical protein